MANTAGLEAGTTVGITAQPGRIIIETSDKLPTLDEMLESFDPKRYGGEAMAFDVKAMTRP